MPPPAPPPLHACPSPLCACSRTVSAAVAARIATTMTVSGLAPLARPALDLFSDSGGAAGGGGGSGRPCSRCPGLAALARTTLIVTVALTLVAAVALTVRLSTAPPSAAPRLPWAASAAPWAREAAEAVREADATPRHRVNAPAPGPATAGRAPPGMEPVPTDLKMDAAAYTVDDADPATAEEPALIVLLPEHPEDVQDHATDVGADEQHATQEVPDAGAISTTTPEAAGTVQDTSTAERVQDDDSQAQVHNEEAVTSTEQSGTKAGGASWRNAPRSSTTSFRKPFRPRVDTSAGGAPPAWKQFEGCALHLRPPHHGHVQQHHGQHHGQHYAAQQHKRHALLPWPGSTAAAPRGLGPLHVVPPGNWQPPRYAAVPPAMPVPVHAGFWAVQPPHQPVWSPAATQQGAPWGQPGPVLYSPPVQGYSQGYQPNVVHLHAGHAGPTAPAPTSPLPGPAWTC